MQKISNNQTEKFDTKLISMADDTTNFDVTISTSTELDVASRINALHEDAERLSKLAKSQAQKAIRLAIECGRLLTEQKAKMSHGEWMPWVEKNCCFTRMTAHRYIKLYSSVNTIEVGKTVSQVSDSSNVTPVLHLNEDTENKVSEEVQTNNFIESLPAKTLKDAYIATGILPPRKEPELKENVPAPYYFEHVKFIDGFVKWYQGFKEKFPLDKMKPETVDTLLVDLSAIVRIYQELAELKNGKFDN